MSSNQYTEGIYLEDGTLKKFKDADLTQKVEELNSKLDDCFQSVSNGKTLIASAITDKNIQTDASDTFEVMANNIESLILSFNRLTLGVIK